MVPVLLSIGSNIAPETNVPAAIARLRRHPAITVLAISSIYESKPVGASGPQPVYHNAAVLADTSLDPATLRAALREIETALGRVRTSDKFAARTIDLDIAMYGEQVLRDGEVDVPDPDIARFPHVAVPLADVAPGWRHPELGMTLKQIADGMQYTDKELWKTDGYSY